MPVFARRRRARANSARRRDGSALQSLAARVLRDASAWCCFGTPLAGAACVVTDVHANAGVSDTVVKVDGKFETRVPVLAVGRTRWFLPPAAYVCVNIAEIDAVRRCHCCYLVIAAVVVGRWEISIIMCARAPVCVRACASVRTAGPKHWEGWAERVSVHRRGGSVVDSGAIDGESVGGGRGIERRRRRTDAQRNASDGAVRTVRGGSRAVPRYRGSWLRALCTLPPITRLPPHRRPTADIQEWTRTCSGVTTGTDGDARHRGPGFLRF